jgi:hypothetical protein
MYIILRVFFTLVVRSHKILYIFILSFKFSIKNEHLMNIDLIETCSIRKLIIGTSCVIRNVECYFKLL